MKGDPHGLQAKIWPLLICLLGFGLLVFRLDGASLWADETRTLEWVQRLAQGGFASLTDETVVHRLSHPPLYFLCLGVWMTLAGDSEFSLRFLSVVFGVLSIAMVYPLGARIVSRRVGLTAMTLMALSPFLIMYSRMVRLYSLELLLCLVSCWFLLRLLECPDSARTWLAYVTSSALAVYTEYLAFFVLAAHAVLAVCQIKHSRRFALRLLGGQLVVLLIFAPWIPYMLRLAAELEGASDAFTGMNSIINWVLSVVHPFFAWIVGETLYPWNPVAVLGVLLATWLAARGILVGRNASANRAVEKAQPKQVLNPPAPRDWLQSPWHSVKYSDGAQVPSVILFILLPLVLTIVTNRCMLSEKSFLDVANKALFCTPFMYLLIGRGLHTFPRREWRLALLVGLAIPLVLSLANYYSAREFHNPTQALPTRAMAHEIVQQAGPGDVFVSDATVGFYHYAYKEDPEAIHFFGSDPLSAINYIEKHQASKVWMVLLCRAVETESRATVELVPWLLSQGYSVDWSQGYAPLDRTYGRLQELILRKPACEFKVIVSRYSRPHQGLAEAKQR